MRRKHHLPAFVISIGNIVVGGTGKTPFTIWLASYCAHLGLRTVVLSRGYGRQARVTAKVRFGRASADLVSEFGDEPVVIARAMPSVPVWVGRKRWIAGKIAIEEHHPQVVILDDGFQHSRLARDLDIVMIDAQNPFGNGCLIPYGPLREPIDSLERADAIIFTKTDGADTLEDRLSVLKNHAKDKPVFFCRRRLSHFKVGMDGPDLPLWTLQNKPAIAFAGVATPRQFYRSLEEAGIVLRQCLTFPDHHRYQPEDLAEIVRSASNNKALFLITTEKDAVRLPEEFQNLVVTAVLQLDFGQDHERLCDYLQSRISPLLTSSANINPQNDLSD